MIIWWYSFVQLYSIGLKLMANPNKFVDSVHSNHLDIYEHIHRGLSETKILMTNLSLRYNNEVSHLITTSTWLLDEKYLKGKTDKHQYFCQKNSSHLLFQSLSISNVELSKLPFRKLFILGDSLANQIYHHMKALLPNMLYDIYHHTVRISLGNCFQDVHTFYLSNMSFFMDSPLSNFLDKVDDENTVIIFNEGAWWDRFVTSDQNRTNVLSWYETATDLMIERAKRFKGKFFFRSILPAHSHCPTQINERAAKHWAARWPIYEKFNAIVEYKTKQANISYLDLTNILQPHYKSHVPKDCMHYCIGARSPLVTAAAYIWVTIIRKVVQFKIHNNKLNQSSMLPAYIASLDDNDSPINILI